MCPDRRRVLAGAAGVLGLLALGGCATQAAGLRARRPADLPAQAELEATPFFPQDERFLCGPESLAAVLQAQGLKITPAELVPLVYLPGRQGSLGSPRFQCNK